MIEREIPRRAIDVKPNKLQMPKTDYMKHGRLPGLGSLMLHYQKAQSTQTRPNKIEIRICQ